MAFYEGQIVGPYQVVGPLGTGGMASVYKAYHAKLDRYVAIKVLHAAFSTETDFIARFEREAQIVAKLEHPHIVPVFDYAEQENQPYLVMKYVEGETLKKVLSRGALPLNEVIRVMGSVADALTYAHRRGVLHRDVKPSNIILDSNGTPYLTDFGLARIAQMGATTMSQDMILGTPQYISPEQANGSKDLDPRTDVYSLGVILYEMVVGRVPFTADTPYAVVHDHIYTELPRPSEINPQIPPAVEAVLVKALSKLPADRYETPNAMMDAFRAAVRDSGLVELDSDRAAQAEQSFVQRVVPPIPAVPAPRRPEADDSDRKFVRIPLPPAPPKPPRATEFEFQIDSENLKDAGRKVEEGLRKGTKWVEKIASQIEVAVREASEGSERGLTPEEIEEKRIRKRVIKRREERNGVIIHMTVYVFVNLMMWMLWAGGIGNIIEAISGSMNDVMLDALAMPWPLIVMFFWGIGLFAHFSEYYNKYGPGYEKREREIQREIERERARSMAYEKPKNERRPSRLELTDDGEITEVFEDEVGQSVKRKRR